MWKRKQKVTDAPVELNRMLVRLNIKRVSLAAVLALAFEVFNLFDKATYRYWYLSAGTFAVALISLIYIVLGYIAERRNIDLRVLRIAYRLYWVLLTLCLTPFFIFDVEIGTVTNVLLFFGLLVTAPVFSMRENKVMFSFFVLYVVVAVMLAGADFLFGVRVAFIGIGCSLLSYELHNGYIDTIRSLRAESALDGLTKLYTKYEGMERMRALLTFCRRMGRTVAVLYIDIDYFKSYNDTFGHQEGDQTLLQVADCLRRCFARETDVLCRLGGEEFAVMIPIAQRGMALMMAKKLLHMVSDMGIQSGMAARLAIVTISIGVAVFEPGGRVDMPIEAIIEEADRQLYIAKSGGRNCIAMGDRIVYRNEEN